MIWPWTSRARLEDARRENEWLRERVAFLEDRLDRRERAKLGLPEEPREQREHIGQMPSELIDHIRRYGSRELQKMQINEAKRRRLRGESWEQIMSDVMGDAA